MQAGDNEILNQEEVDTVGNKEDDLDVELLETENKNKKNPYKDLAIVGMREEGVGEHE